MRAPEFWRADHASIAPALLSPLSLLFRAGAHLRTLGTSPWRAPVPVICVGNLTVGGSGKTPTVLAIADRLLAAGLRVACLSRGYGGAARGPLQVDLAHHSAAEVGDEPLLLAQMATTWVARDRKEGAQAAIVEGADILLLDDGLQNPTLRKDITLSVIDGGFGFGNRRVLPAGPLRETIESGLAHTSAVVLIGDDSLRLADELVRRVPVIRASLEPADSAFRLKGRKVFAFAGIGRPAKFFDTVRQLGAELVGTAEFPDHHPFSEDEAMRVVENAERLQAIPVTTTKDFVRLPEGARRMVTVIGIHLRFENPLAIDDLLRPVIGEGGG